ncbi:squalene/phytoene synthase family protein [Pelagibacterales bacterium SAG-MED17]|nr:squalene/phytoene synthase family protein [Pelagibacterales bacterium SAG-MED17]
MEKNNYLSIYAKSFNWAGFFLPKKTYSKCSNLYDFCRTLDNIADDGGETEIKLRRFLNFKDNFNNQEFQNPIIKNMWELMDEYNISKNIVYDLFDGVESDIQNKVKLNSKKELLIYSYRVAGTVGLMMAKILNVTSSNSLKSAIDLGIAMQLTNISRDVVEDSKNKRFYIKQDFETIKETLTTADLFYESSFSSIKDIPLSLRFSILVARRVYRQIGRNIIKKQTIQNYNQSGKIFVSNSGKIFQTILSIYDLLKLSLIKKQYHLRDKEHGLISEEISLNERF